MPASETQSSSSASLASSSSPTSAGLALPPVCFMTWPRRKPLTASGFFLPRFSSSMAWGLAAIAADDRGGDLVAVGDHLVAAHLDDDLGGVARLDHPAQDLASLVGVQLAPLDPVDQVGQVRRDGPGTSATDSFFSLMVRSTSCWIQLLASLYSPVPRATAS